MEPRPILPQPDKPPDQEYKNPAVSAKGGGQPTVTPVVAAQSATAQFALLNGKLVKIAPYGGTNTGLLICPSSRDFFS